MRFWLVIIFILGSVYFCYAKFFGSDDSETDTQSLPSAKSVATMVTGADPEKSIPKDTPKKIIPRPVATRSVVFLHRPLPSFEILSNILARPVNSPKINPSHRNQKSITGPARAVRFTIDPETNSVLLIGDLEEVTRLADMLKNLDKVVSTCHLKTWVVFVRGDKKSGFDLVAKMISGSSSSALLGGGIFSGALNLGNIQLSLQAGASNGLLEIVDEPYMQLIQARKSTITTGEEIAIASTTVNQGVSQTSVEFKKVGLSLGVTPYFLAHDRVRLNVEQKNDVVGSSLVIDGNPVPEISTQSLNTSVEMRLGQIIVLGGVESAKRETRRGWIHKKDERTIGHLYVVAAVYSTAPKALPVLDVSDDFPIHPTRQRPVKAFIDDAPGLLPKLRLPR